ncbi:MAG: hypothetical protein IJF32_10280, partial [Oscillospiraceae bacterium]|nr:hypothetical protein [Oscillospiraceae bacterium]
MIRPCFACSLRNVSEDALYSAMLGALTAGLLEGPGVVAETYAENIKKSTGNTSAKVPVENTTAPSWTSETTEPNPVDDVTISQSPKKSNRQNMPEGDPSVMSKDDTRGTARYDAEALKMQNAKGKMQSETSPSPAVTPLPEGEERILPPSYDGPPPARFGRL